MIHHFTISFVKMMGNDVPRGHVGRILPEERAVPIVGGGGDIVRISMPVCRSIGDPVHTFGEFVLDYTSHARPIQTKWPRGTGWSRAVFV